MHVSSADAPRDARPLCQRVWRGGARGAVAIGDSGGDAPRSPDPFAPKKPHFAAKAKTVIFLYMDGGPSQVDTFDPKPRLEKEHGQPIAMKVEPTQFNNVGNTLASPVEVPAVRRERHSGQRPVPARRRRASTTWPSSARWSSNFSEHTNANYFLHTGHGQQGRPSMGAWVTYGLGSECRDLPGFVVLDSGMIPPGGLDCFGSGFLPAAYQGSMFQPRRAPGRRHRAARGETPKPAAAQARPAPQARSRRRRSGSATTTRSKRRSPTTSWPSACRRPCRS